MPTETAKDSRGVSLQVFVPTIGKELTTGLLEVYTPEETEVVKLVNNVSITIDGVEIPYLAGDVIGLHKGIGYTMSVATSAHVM